MTVRALFVGIDNYDDYDAFPSLRFAASDAGKIRTTMLGSAMALSADNAKLLTDKDAADPLNRGVLIQAVKDLGMATNMDDTIFFYFAGHGFFTEFAGAELGGSYLAAADARNYRGQPEPDSAVSVEHVRRILVESRAAHILIVFDACRYDIHQGQSGGAGFGRDFSDRAATSRSATSRGPNLVWQIISACDPASLAYEDHELGAGRWTYCLCEALEKHSADLLNNGGGARVVFSHEVFDTAKELLSKSFRDSLQIPRLYSVPGDTIPLLLCVDPAASTPVVSTSHDLDETPWQDLANEILTAQRRLSVQIGDYEPARPTPLKRSRRLEDRYGCARLYFKLESLQNTGSFKYRGAMNAVERLHELGERKPLVAPSAGNHGLGLAVAAQHRDLECHIFMPKTTPLTKVNAVDMYATQVHLCGEDYDDCEREAMTYGKERDATFVHPFHDPYVVAGQGTIALELVEQWSKLCEENKNLGDPDLLIIPCGGGGLLVGIATIIRSKWPNTKIIAVEPQRVPSLTRAFERDSPVQVPSKSTLADGIAVRMVGSENFACLRGLIDSECIARVRENSIAVAVLNLLEDARVIAEGAGAASLAAMAEMEAGSKGCLAGKTVICVISGGNLDISSLSSIVSRGLLLQDRRTTIVFRVADRPGELADVTRALADLEVNVIDLAHNRFGDRVGLDHAQVEVLVETQNALHASKLFRDLEDRGFEVFRLGM